MWISSLKKGTNPNLLPSLQEDCFRFGKKVRGQVARARARGAKAVDKWGMGKKKATNGAHCG